MLAQNKLRLMHITHDLRIGGLQQVVVNLCRAVDKTKFDVSVLCLRNGGPLVQEVERLGIPVYCLPPALRTDYLSFLKVAKILKHKKIDVIHTHNTQPLVDGVIGALLAGKVKNIVHTDHGRMFPDKKRYMLAEWMMSHFTYKIAGVSDTTAQNLIKYEKMAPKKITVIMNGIDGSRYRIPADKKIKKKELSIDGDGPLLGIAARLVREKGITYLLKAIPKIKKLFPGVTLLIAGTGEREQALRKEARELAIDKNTLFLGDRLDIPDLLKLFDVFVLPSISEGLPMVLLEAMAAGCPIVATKAGGIGTAITHGENGSLVEPGDPEQLADEIIRVVSDRDLRNRYVRTGLDCFEKRFSAEKMARQYERLYLREA